MRLVATAVCRFSDSEMHFGRLGKAFVSQESPGTSQFHRACGQRMGRWVCTPSPTATTTFRQGLKRGPHVQRWAPLLVKLHQQQAVIKMYLHHTDTRVLFKTCQSNVYSEGMSVLLKPRIAEYGILVGLLRIHVACNTVLLLAPIIFIQSHRLNIVKLSLQTTDPGIFYPMFVADIFRISCKCLSLSLQKECFPKWKIHGIFGRHWTNHVKVFA